ncbi:MAG: hypothetical protein KGV59_06165 [Tenacibaculum sp.]|nr:hypothetical protein [Tenacibaculum sp.]
MLEKLSKILGFIAMVLFAITVIYNLIRFRNETDIMLIYSVIGVVGVIACLLIYSEKENVKNN